MDHQPAGRIRLDAAGQPAVPPRTQRTANAWLERQDAHREQVLRVLAEAYGKSAAPLCHQRWRMFWMACAELFGYDDGNEWLVGHYRFSRR